MGTSVNLSASSGGGDGYRGELPLERELERPIEIDALELRSCHPMFALRLRMFVDWHRAAGNEVLLRPPNRAAVAERLAAMAVVPDDMSSMEPGTGSAIMLSLRKLATYHDVEDAATDATSVLAGQAADLAVWGAAMHMAIGELCDNALLHGALGNDLGAYVAADRTDNERGREFRLAIADLGIGIPEHIRAQHPEWHDDTAAIGRALQRGVSGTGDPHRGNGFSEVFDTALENQLVRGMSAAKIDIRSGKGRVTVELVGGVQRIETPAIEGARRGTWITYTVTTV